MQGATIVPEAVFDVDRPCSPTSRRSGSRCCRARPRCSSRSSTTPTGTTYDLSSLRLAVTGAAAVPVELVRRMREELTFATDRHRLRADRVDRHGDDVPPRRRSRDDRRTRRAGPSRTSRCRSSTTTAREVAPGEPGEIVVPRLQRDARLLRGPRRDGARPSTPTAGCTPATSASWTTAGYLRITDRKKDMFIVGGFNAYPAEIESAILAPPRRRPGRGGRVSPTPGWARWACAFVVPRPGADVDPDELIAWARRRDGQLQGAPARRWSSTPSRSTPAARCSSTSCGSGPDVDRRHENTRAVVTGAGSGIGQATAPAALAAEAQAGRVPRRPRSRRDHGRHRRRQRSRLGL